MHGHNSAEPIIVVVGTNFVTETSIRVYLVRSHCHILNALAQAGRASIATPQVPPLLRDPPSVVSWQAL